MFLRFLKFNDYRSWLYLTLFSLAFGIFGVSFITQHEKVFDNSVVGLLRPGYSENLAIKIAGVLLLMANVFLFDYILVSQELTDNSNHAPAFVLGLFLIFALNEYPLHPQLFAQLLLTFSFGRFVATYRIEKAGPKIFDGSFALACAVIIYPSYWVFIAVGIISLAVLRAFQLREYMLIIIGVALPYLFYFTTLYICDLSLEKPLSDIANSFHTPSLPPGLKGSFIINFVTALVVFFTIIFFFLKGTLSGRIKTQKALVIFLWALIPCAAAVFTTDNHYVFVAYLAIMPVSLFTGIYFHSAKRRTFAEILLLVLIAAVLLSVLQHAEVISLI